MTVTLAENGRAYATASWIASTNEPSLENVFFRGGLLGNVISYCSTAPARWPIEVRYVQIRSVAALVKRGDFDVLGSRENVLQQLRAIKIATRRWFICKAFIGSGSSAQSSDSEDLCGRSRRSRRASSSGRLRRFYIVITTRKVFNPSSVSWLVGSHTHTLVSSRMFSSHAPERALAVAHQVARISSVIARGASRRIFVVPSCTKSFFAESSSLYLRQTRHRWLSPLRSLELGGNEDRPLL
ncbi:hypothetical protein F5Y05DRAFT_48967 [Hypoxylon sp. FL0543]|nr:hypothetical protein F5Y05DRAFT_48967 [Hypoxylon sp. FL0543]